MRIITTAGKSRYLDVEIPDIPSGPPTAETGALVNTFVAGETLGGQRLVVLKDTGAFYFDPTNETHYNLGLGFTKTAASIGENVDVIMAGVVGAMSLVAGSVYWAAANGTITTTVPSSGIQLKIGVAKSSSILAINLSQPLILI